MVTAGARSAAAWRVHLHFLQAGELQHMREVALVAGGTQPGAYDPLVELRSSLTALNLTGTLCVPDCLRELTGLRKLSEACRLSPSCASLRCAVLLLKPPAMCCMTWQARTAVHAGLCLGRVQQLLEWFMTRHGTFENIYPLAFPSQLAGCCGCCLWLA